MKTWTTSELREARALLEGGAGYDVIAALLGRTPGSVRERLRPPERRAANRHWRAWTEEEVQYLVQRHAQCAGARAIANYLGRPRQEVYRKAAEQGLLFHEQRPWDDIQDSILREFEDKPLRAAAILRRSLPQVLQRLRTLRASSGVSPSIRAS